MSGIKKLKNFIPPFSYPTSANKDKKDLFAGSSSPLVPGEVAGIALVSRGFDGRVLQLIGPAVLLTQGDGRLLVGEGHLNVGEGVGSGGPPHEGVLPPLLCVPLHDPPLLVGCATLHSILGGPLDSDLPALDMLLWHTRYKADVIRNIYSNAEGVSVHNRTIQCL